MDITIAPVIFGFFGVLIGGFFTFLGTYMSLQHQSELARAAQKEARRTARHQYLLDRMPKLEKAFEDHEQFLNKYGAYKREKHEGHEEEYAAIIGPAIAACYAICDGELTVIAEERLTRVFTKKHDDWGEYPDRNRNGLVAAIQRLGVLLEGLLE